MSNPIEEALRVAHDAICSLQPDALGTAETEINGEAIQWHIREEVKATIATAYLSIRSGDLVVVDGERLRKYIMEDIWRALPDVGGEISPSEYQSYVTMKIKSLQRREEDTNAKP